MCFGDSTLFSIADTLGIDSVLWNFGDTLSDENTSRNFFAKHKFTHSGLFEISLDMWRLGVKYVKRRIIMINSLPSVTHSNDTAVCTGDNALLYANCDNCTVFWQDTIQADSINVNAQGNYIMKAIDNYTYCSFIDTIHLDLLPLPVFDISDTSICTGDTIFRGYDMDNCHYLWNNGDTNAFIEISNAGIYTLQITDSMSCKYTDTFFVGNLPLPVFNLGNDTIMCDGDSIILHTGDYHQALWNGFLTADSIIVKVPAIYFAKVVDSNSCSFSDTIQIVRKTVPFIADLADTSFCEGQTLTLSYACNQCQVIWNNQYPNQITIDTAGTYELKVSNICGTTTADIQVYSKYCGEIYIPNIFTPNNDGINEYFKIKGIDNAQWKLFIFNRWGNLVFFSDDYQNNWDGGNCPNGTYYYILQNANSPSQKLNGTVTIYRPK